MEFLEMFVNHVKYAIPTIREAVYNGEIVRSDETKDLIKLENGEIIYYSDKFHYLNGEEISLKEQDRLNIFSTTYKV